MPKCFYSRIHGLGERLNADLPSVLEVWYIYCMTIREDVERLGNMINSGRDDTGKFDKNNYHGRRLSLTQALHNFLESDTERVNILAQTVYETAVTKGTRGQIPAINSIWERLDGKVADKSINVNINGDPQSYQALLKQIALESNPDTELLEQYPRHQLTDTPEKPWNPQ